MKTERQMEQRIDHLKSKIERLDKIANAPMQTPGPFVTGRSGYTMGKQLDRENERKAKAFSESQEAKREVRRLEAILEGYRNGECHLNGQPRQDSPSRRRLKDAQVLWAEFMREQIVKGDNVALVANPDNQITIKRINKKSVTSASGSRWAYGEIIPLQDGKPMSHKALRVKFKAWMGEREESV